MAQDTASLQLLQMVYRRPLSFPLCVLCPTARSTEKDSFQLRRQAAEQAAVDVHRCLCAHSLVRPPVDDGIAPPKPVATQTDVQGGFLFLCSRGSLSKGPLPGNGAVAAHALELRRQHGTVGDGRVSA